MAALYPENIPEELKDSPSWVLWKKEAKPEIPLDVPVIPEKKPVIPPKEVTAIEEPVIEVEEKKEKNVKDSGPIEDVDKKNKSGLRYTGKRII